MDDMMKNIDSARDDFMDQKETLQQEAELGETAAKIAAKAPVSPETVIETVMTARKIRSQMAQYALPLMVALLSIIAAGVSWNMYAHKDKHE